MDTVAPSSGQKNRFLKLSLKKNKKNVVCEDRNVNSPYQDLSFEDLTRHVFRNAQKLSRNCSIITLHDSDSECSSKTSKSPVQSDFENDQNDDLLNHRRNSDTDVQGFERLNLNTNRKLSNEFQNVTDSKTKNDNLCRESKCRDEGHSLSPDSKNKSIQICLTPNPVKNKYISDSDSSSKKSPVKIDIQNDKNDDMFDRIRYSVSDHQRFDNLNYNTNRISSNELRQAFDFNKRNEDSFRETKTNDKGLSPSPHQKNLHVNLCLTPNTEHNVTRESIEHCTVEKIRLSQQKVLDELYGEQWRSIPTLFKTSPQKHFDNLKARRLSFSDEDKENTEAKEKKTEKRIETKKADKKTTKIPSVTNKTKEKTEIKKKVIVEKDVLKPTSKNNNAKVCVGKVKVAIAKSVENIEVKKLGFMASLADNVPTWRCDLEALDYKKNFKSKKEQLAQKLYSIFNTMIFNRQLHENMLIEWDAKLRSTAGMTMNRLHRTKSSTGDPTRTSSIKLSTKVIDSAQRLRDTLVHEMCHAATWLVDHELRAGHGPLWKRWAARSLRILPELGEISRCHDMQIHFKFTYKCTKCGYSINRHSKSIDTERKRCGYCYGTLELIVNKKTKEGLVVSTPAKQVEVNDFALFVKENYGSVKKDKTKTHAQVMKTLGEQYSLKKALRKNDGSEIN